MTTPRRAGFVAALLFVALAPGPSLGAGNTLKVTGAVRTALALDEESLKALPQQAVDVTFETGKGEETGHYDGPLLWSIVEKAGPVDEPGKNAALRHTVRITGRDGYQVSIAFGEIDPDYEGKPIVLAIGADNGAASPSAPRLVVPGDRHGGRAVRDVVQVEVK